MLKMLLKTNLKCVENIVWLKYISKQIYFKTDKLNMIKQTVSKQIHFKKNRKNQPNGPKAGSPNRKFKCLIVGK